MQWYICLQYKFYILIWINKYQWYYQNKICKKWQTTIQTRPLFRSVLLWSKILNNAFLSIHTWAVCVTHYNPNLFFWKKLKKLSCIPCMQRYSPMKEYSYVLFLYTVCVTDSSLTHQFLLDSSRSSWTSHKREATYYHDLHFIT